MRPGDSISSRPSHGTNGPCSTGCCAAHDREAIVSVILDALRRSRNRRDGTAQNPSSREVPAALGLGASSASAVGRRPARTRLLGMGLLLVIGLGAWAVIQVARVLIMKDAPAQSSSASGASVPVTPAAPNAAQPPPSPPANPAES